MTAAYRIFFGEFFRTFRTTGSIAPSSRWLARELTHYVAAHPADGRAREILEVGPGTGAVTGRLIDRLAPNDHLTLVELNDRFVDHLRHCAAHDHKFAPAAGRLEIVHDRLENLPSDKRYDVIVSGLPLNNFSVSDVEQILGTLSRLLAPGGTLSFFEYAVLRPLRTKIGSRSQRQRLRGISTLLDNFLAQGQARRQWVLANAPPAWVHHLQSRD